MRIAPYARTLVAIAVLLALALPKEGGHWLLLALPIFVVWTLYSAARLIFKPAERRARGTRLAAWAAALALAGAAQAYWGGAVRQQADVAAAAVLAHRASAGSYPASLVEAGLDEPALRGEWRVVYRVTDGQPRLSYPAALMPLSAYEYDFEARRWVLDAY